jgi:hypothetical protein
MAYLGLIVVDVELLEFFFLVKRREARFEIEILSRCHGTRSRTALGALTSRHAAFLALEQVTAHTRDRTRATAASIATSSRMGVLVRAASLFTVVCLGLVVLNLLLAFLLPLRRRRLRHTSA